MKRKVIVVEYEPRYVKRITEALTAEGMDFHHAKDGEEGWNLIKKEKPEIIFMSAVLPKLRSNELIQKIRSDRHCSDARIILMLTGVSDHEAEAEAERRNVDTLLPKPFSKDRVIEVLNPAPAEEESEEKPAEKSDTVMIPTREEEPPAGDGDDLLDVVKSGGEKLSSQDLFGEIIKEDESSPPSETPEPDKKPEEGPGKKTEPSVEIPKPDKQIVTKVRPTGSVDDMLKDTLTGSKSSSRKTKSVTSPNSGELEKRLTETLAGLEMVSPPARKTAPQPPEPMKKETAPTPPPAAPEAPVEQPAAPSEPPEAKAKPVAEEKPAEPAAKPAEKKKKPPEPKPAEKEDPNTFGEYVLLDKIATGGMAEIHKAKKKGEEGFEKLVAIKKILPHLSQNTEFTTMFIDEAKVAAQLSHRNIIHIYDFGKIKDSYYIAMEHIEGADLRSILMGMKKINKTLSPAIAISIGIQLASALAYAHGKKDPSGKKSLEIVHRDVSPQNILISREGEVKLIDFGIAKAASKASHTRAGALKGKLQYMSPEQAWGKDIDNRSDIFSLGIVLYEMLSGKQLFSGDSEISILEKVRNPEYVPLTRGSQEIPAELDDILARALQKDIEDRFENAETFQKELESLLENFRPQPMPRDLSNLAAFGLAEVKELSIPSYTYIPRDEPISEVKKEEATKKPEPKPPVKKTKPEKKKTEEKKPAPVKPKPAVKPPKPKPTSSPMMEDFEEGAKKKFPVIWLGIAAAVIVVIVAVFTMTGKKEEPTAPPQQIPPPIEKPVEDPVPDDPQIDPEPAVQKPAPVKKPPKTKPKPTPQTKPPVEKPAPVPEPEPQKPAPEPEPEPEPVQQEPEPVPEPVQQEPEPKPEPVKPKPEPEPEPQDLVPPKPHYNAGDLVPIGTPGLVPPKLKRKPSPRYPTQAKRQNIQGVIVIQVLVDAKGKAESVKALTKKPFIADAAIRAAEKAVFTPATFDGKKVKCYFTLTYNFKL